MAIACRLLVTQIVRFATQSASWTCHGSAAPNWMLWNASLTFGWQRKTWSIAVKRTTPAEIVHILAVPLSCHAYVLPMRVLPWLTCGLICAGISAGLLVGVSPAGWLTGNPAAIEEDLEIAPPGGEPIVGLHLPTALAVLHVPSISVALIDGGQLAWARVWGDASVSTRYQTASLSKLVTAVAALRLVEQGRLALDRDVNADLSVWHIPDSDLTRGDPVTLRGLRWGSGLSRLPSWHTAAKPAPNSRRRTAVQFATGSRRLRSRHPFCVFRRRL